MITLSQADEHWARQLLDWVLPRAESDTLETKRVSGKMVGKALESGLLINVTGDTVVRLLPALNFSEADARELVSRLSLLIREFLTG